MASVLLYNLVDTEKYPRLKTVLMMLGISPRHVLPQEQALPLETLLSSDSAADSTPIPADAFSEEMMVLCHLNQNQFNKLLDAMKRNRCTVSLKAVLTETNAAWDSIRLHSELSAERLSFRSAKGQTVHSK